MALPTKFTDSYLEQGIRRRMCDDLRGKGITDARVLEAMQSVPRHWFVDPTLGSNAYTDNALPINCGQTISRPSTVAMQSQILEVQQGMKVLEVGTGSGYQTAVLCAMGARVYSIERQYGLFVETKRRLRLMGYKAECFYGDGYKGTPTLRYAPFDRVIITCGAPYVPADLMQQLKLGGLMVIPVGEGEQEMLRIVKEGESEAEWKTDKMGNYRFVPMLEGRQFAG